GCATWLPVARNHDMESTWTSAEAHPRRLMVSTRMAVEPENQRLGLKKLLLTVGVTASLLWPQAAGPFNRPKQSPLNVTAFGSRGEPVEDLAEGEFQIEDEGQWKNIAHFERVAVRQSPPAPIEQTPTGARAYSNRPDGDGPRSGVVILLDLLNRRTPR